MENNEDLNELPPLGRSRLRAVLKYFVLAVCLLLVTAGIVYGLARQTPEFYRDSLSITDEEAFDAGASFEIAGLYLRNDVVEEETWYAEFFEDHINGWLASDMPRKFARALPENMQHPRVRIESGKFRVGVTTEIIGIETVLAAAVEFFPTEVSDEFGLRVLSVRAGSLPLPVSFFNQPATELFQKHGIRVRWYDDKQGQPVAVMNIPTKLLSHEGQRIMLEQFEFTDGSVRLAGRSEPIKKKKNPKTEEDSESVSNEDKSTTQVSDAPEPGAPEGQPIGGEVGD